jgi:hypothetical protein
MSLCIELDGLITGIVTRHVTFSAINAEFFVDEGDHLLLGYGSENSVKFPRKLREDSKK